MSNAATPAEPLASGLVMHCALGAVTSSESQKKDTKRATSCEVALSKRLVEFFRPKVYQLNE